MRELPILFSTPMVQAILNGTKTQTRRIFKDENGEARISTDVTRVNVSTNGVATLTFPLADGTFATKVYTYKCPYGGIGDRLWVRETWANTERGDLLSKPLIPFYYNKAIAYKADCDKEVFSLGGNYTPREYDFKWHPSIHMPRWASRITLEITNIRLERVQDITEEDARAEGVERQKDGLYKDYLLREHVSGCSTSEASFQTLWESINAKRGFGWGKNLWVWAIGFQRVK